MENQNKTALAKDRTTRASKRTKLANTRTFLSYVRTALILISVAIAFFKIEKRFDWVCIGFAIACGVVLIIGIIHYLAVDQYIKGVNNEE